MNLELVGEPGVSAFLRSVLQNLGDTGPMKRDYTAYLFYDPRQDLEKLEEKLVLFQGLVVDGEAKRLADQGADQWMDDLNDLLYHVEDILDDIRRLRNDQVRDNIPYLQELSVDIISRFENNILARAESLGRKAETLKLERGRECALWGESKVTMRSTRETSSMVDISEIRGRENDKTEIVKRLLKVDAKRKKNYDVVGIWGMGGLGKTTLAQLVFNDPEVVKHFDVQSWVCISDVFDVRKAIQGLIGDGSAGDAQSLQNLHQLLQKMIQNKRFLFVLDDVWSSTEWDAMKAPFNSCKNGSKILVTTRDCKIAHALGDAEPYKLERLLLQQCMLLFKDKAFGNGDVDEGEIEKLMIYGEKMVRACKGVPLAVKVIGSMLQMAKEEKWRAVSEKAAIWDEAFKKNDEIHPAIRLSYHYLPASLKRCFKYLAIFPPDYAFIQNDVVRLWIADGLVQEEEGRSIEDIGDEYYNELKARSFIQENDIMHDLGRAPISNLPESICDLSQMQDLYLYGCKGLKQLPKDIGNLRSLRTLDLTETSISSLPESICALSQLQVLNLKECDSLKIYQKILATSEAYGN